MPTCPNCGSIVMEGDPYCSHCGAHFKWSYFDEEDDTPDYRATSEFAYGETFSHDSYSSETDYDGFSRFLDFGEVSETYLEADEEKLEYIASHICADSSQKLQLKAQIREYQKAEDFKGFYIKKDYGFEVYYFHFIQENEYVKTTHVMTYRQDEYAIPNPYNAFYESYSEHDHGKLIANPRFKKLIESVGFEFEGCGGGYKTHLESGNDETLTGEIRISVRFKVGNKIRVYYLNLNEMKLCPDYYEYDPNEY
jgi:hypothetical protein